MNRTKRKRVFVVITFLIFCLLVTIVYQFVRNNTFEYSNLVDNEGQAELQFMLETNGIPHENIETLLSLCDEFYSVPYNNVVNNGWNYALIRLFSYNANDANDHLTRQPDNSLTCRMAAFIVLKNDISFGETKIVPAHMKDPASRKNLTYDEDLLHYDLLFSNIENSTVTSTQDLADIVIGYWKNAGITFENESVRLITAYGLSGTTIQNFHTAIAIYNEDGVWLLEKYDPIYPFQFSCFSSESQLIDYMKKRVSDTKYYAIFSNDNCIYHPNFY